MPELSDARMGGVSSSVRGKDLVCMVAWRGLKTGDFSSKGCVWKLCSPLSHKGVAQLKGQLGRESSVWFTRNLDGMLLWACEEGYSVDEL